MKRNILIIVILALVLAVGIYYGVKFAPQAIETVIPEKAALYVKLSDIGKQAEELKSSRLWKNIKGIDIEMLMEKSGAKKEEIERYKVAKSEITSFLGGLVIDKYFGKEIAFALYPAQTGEASPDTALKSAPNLALVTRIKPETDFIDFISKVLNKFNRKYEIAEEDYKGRKITMVKLNGDLELVYVRIKDLLVIGLDRKVIVSCCDVADGKASSLAQDKDYLSTMSKLAKGARNIAYGDMELLVREIRQFMYAFIKSHDGTEPGPQQVARDKIDKTLNMYAGFRAFGYARYPGKIAKEKVVMTIDRSKLHPLYATFYSLPPRKDKALKFAPLNTIYYGRGSFDPKSYWEYLRSELTEQIAQTKQAPSFNDTIAEFERNSGISIDKDIIPALGDELGIFLIDIDLDGLVPMAEFVFFIKVDKKQPLDGLADYFIKEGKVNFQSEIYNGIDIKYIALPSGENFQPAYCYISDYLLVSLGRKPIKESIDTYKGALKPLFENEDFKAVNHGLTDANNSITFIKTDVLLQKAEDICEWGRIWMSVIVEQQKKYRQIVDTKLDSLTKEVAKDEAELEEMGSAVQALEKEIEDLKLQEVDVSLKEDELAGLRENIRLKQSAIDTKREYLMDLEAQSQRKSPIGDIDVSLVKLYLDKAVYPILDGMKSLKAIGSRTSYGENVIQTESFSKIVE